MKEEVIDPIFGTQLKKNQFYTWLIFGFHMVSELFRKQMFMASIFFRALLVEENSD